MEEKKANPEANSMENWEEALEETLADSEAKRGEVREGTVLAVKKDGLVVDISAKRDGFVPEDDLEELEEQEFSEGDTVHVMVTRPSDANGNVELSIAQALEHQDWIEAEKLLESQEVYEATITGSNRGGLTIDFGRIRGFIPMSQLIGFSNIRQAAERYRRLRGMIGEELLLKVIEVNRHRRRLILSQRAAAKEWRAARRENLMDDLEAGQVRKGRISQITDFGLFVNLGGLDGLVHISELSWGRIENPG
ncbi:MAG: S1 RNA-binding domain-containing protein, partial [Chloroflexi bacterium]|nr:S1 RNA-binding domain-containing protein [Chloroflexota bacterium]